MRRQPGVLPCIALGVVRVDVSERIEGGSPAAVQHPGTGEAGFGVHVVAVAVAAQVEEDGVFVPAQGARGICDRGVGDGEFHILAQRLPAEVGGDESIFDAEFVTYTHRVQ